MQLPARSDSVPEGQSSSSLAVCAIPAWAVFAQAGLSPGHSSAPPARMWPGAALSPASSQPCCQAHCPGRGTLCPLPSPAPCSYAQEKNWSRAHMTTEGGSAHIHKTPAIRLMPSGVHHTASCTSTNPGGALHSAEDKAETPLRLPCSCPQQYPTCCLHCPLPRAWPEGTSGASAGWEDCGVPGPFVE